MQTEMITIIISYTGYNSDLACFAIFKQSLTKLHVRITPRDAIHVAGGTLYNYSLSAAVVAASAPGRHARTTLRNSETNYSHMYTCTYIV